MLPPALSRLSMTRRRFRKRSWLIAAMKGDAMEDIQDLIRIRVPLHAGSELRIRNSGEICLGDPQVGLPKDTRAVDAVLLYHFDQRSGEHVIRLLEPIAEHTHYRA
jgi:hypothetical protein